MSDALHDSLSETQYRTLCAACDAPLQAPDASIERVAIPWLHVVREHPVFLESYAALFERQSAAVRMGARWRRIARNRASWVRQLWRAVCSNGAPWWETQNFPANADVLFVSHLLNTTHAGRADDFYFANVPGELAARGDTAVIALINYSGESAQALVGKWSASATPRAILENSLSLPEERALRGRFMIESKRLRTLAHGEQRELQRNVLIRASEEALSGGSLTMLRVATQIGMLVARLQPRALVITHEGHAWERVVFASARRAHPGIKCFGYQHAALFRLQHAIRRSLARDYDPDFILTAGRIGERQLQKAAGLHGIPVRTLGSNRTVTGCILGTEPDELQSPPACLVLPEGIVGECHLLFEFSLACARSCPQVQFIWRLHPIVSYESLAKHSDALRDLPANVTVSRRSFAEDLAVCHWALYRGSTAVVQAVCSGLQPIYLERPGEMTIDPLHELQGYRVNASTPADFVRLLNVPVDDVARCAARQYCADFFTPLDAQVIFDSIASSVSKSRTVPVN